MKEKRFVFDLLTFVLGSLIVLGFSGRAFAVKSDGLDSAARVCIQEAYGKLPLHFIRNEGQVNEKVKFYEKGRGHSTFFTNEGVYLQLISRQPEPGRRFKSVKPATCNSKSEIIGLLPLGANKGPEIIAEDLQKGKVNYFTGNDRKKWRTNIPTYRAVMYKEVYDGIDMRFYGNNRQLEYDLIVKPGADPSIVKLSYEGIKGLKVTEKGDLDIILKQRSLTQKKPYIYQEIDGRRVEVAGRFKILNAQSTVCNQQSVYGFEVASYNKNHPLIIDPVLVYSTYLGGSGNDSADCIAVDAAGNAYISGNTDSIDFPTQNPIQVSFAGSRDVFVTKIDASGSSLSYSTYLGGSDFDRGFGIAVDAAGNAYISGYTESIDFPIQNPIQASFAGGLWDAFVARIDASGSSLTYSTYLGGSDYDYGCGIAVDTAENAYISGITASIDFPTKTPIQGSFGGGLDDVFITKIDASGSSLSYSTYLGGSGSERSYRVAVDTAGNAYITGFTWSIDFPTQNPIQASCIGRCDAFITKVNATGSSLSYSTYLGGSDMDCGKGIAVDVAGNVYISGWTQSTDFPTQVPIQGSFGGGKADAFVTKIIASGAGLSYSTYLGGSGDDRGGDDGLAVDTAGNAYITGWTNSIDFPTKDPIQASLAGLDDAFVTRIDASGTNFSYSTYLGGSNLDQGWGIAVDAAGNAYISGWAQSIDFPTKDPIQASNAGGSDAFVTKFDSDLSGDNIAPTAVWKPALTQEGILSLDGSNSIDEDGEIVSHDWQLVGQDTTYLLQGEIVTLNDIPWGCYDGTLTVIDDDALSESITFQICKPKCDPGIPTDVDEDGYSIEMGDCDDNDPAINPGASEVDDGIDNNCNGVTDEGFDNDGDGFTELFGEDCNDNDLAINPGATEVDDGLDNNCNGETDEGFDDDGDGFTEVFGEDCNDNNPAINPGASEVDDGLDNNCNGEIDEGFDDDGDGFTELFGGDCDDNDPAINPGAVELPGNIIDENCDGSLGDCDPDYPWKNHGEYVRCVSHEVEELVNAGLITDDEGDSLVKSAAQSDIGKK